jgi:hypothetical protein
LAKPKAHPWFQRAAELIVRESKTPWQAFNEVGAECTQHEAEQLFKSKAFQQTLQIEKQHYYKELANTPGRDKTSAIGLLYHLVNKLIDSGEYDKAIAGLEKLMKAEGWTGAEQTVNIFNLSPKELEEARLRLKNATQSPSKQESYN